MATRRAVGVGRALVPLAEAVARRMEVGGGRRVPRYLSDKVSGRLLSEEERAAENVYIQKMEREKLRRKADKDKAEAAKRAAAAAKGEKRKGEEEAHPS